MRSDEWRGVKWWRRGTYCCKGCRSRRAGAGREHWGAPSSFPLPVSVALPLSYVFSSSLQLLFALPRFFSLILETQPSSRSEKQEKPFGGKMSEGTPGSNRLTSKRAEEGAKDRGVRLCVWERKQQAGDGHRRPLLGKGRSTHSLFGLLSHSHPPLLSRSPDSAWMPHQPHSLSLSPQCLSSV